MKIVLADVNSKDDGVVTKDTVAGGYGSRFRGISFATKWAERARRYFQNLPSIQAAYLAGIFAAAGHEVVFSDGALVEGDLGLVLTSIVDYRNEIRWAEASKEKFGMRVGYYGTFATHVTDPLVGHGDFIIKGEPEHAAFRLAKGEVLEGIVNSPAINDLDSLPFPRWDLMAYKRFANATGRSLVPAGTAFPLLSSRSCPEFCTYCPHRITASYRSRSPRNVLDEIEQICKQYGRAHIVFRDPLFSEERERSYAIAEGIYKEKMPVTFECETRLDDMDKELIDTLARAGLRNVNFGVESVSPLTLKKVGRRYIPGEHQKMIVSYLREKGISSEAFYVFGFLTDTFESIRGTIDYAIELNTTIANFKILTPYPDTPLRRQMEKLVTEKDLQKFDGYTPTFNHPNLSHEQLLYLLKSAYARFYVRPSWGWNYLRLPDFFKKWVGHADAYVSRRHQKSEAFYMSQDSQAGQES